MRCPSCGGDLAAAGSCPTCGGVPDAVPPGAKLVIQKAPDTGPIAGSQRTLMDVGVSGQETHAIIPITKAVFSLGRTSENDIPLNHPTVSKRHAEVSYRDGAFWIEDLGSTSGTRVNGQDIERHKLAPNDRIKIAKFILVFVWPDAAGGEKKK